MRYAGWDYEPTVPRSGSGWVHAATGPRPLDVQLDDLAFVPHGETGGRDAYLTLERIEGWWEPAPDSTATMDHWSGDGTVPLMPRLGSRRVDLRGQIHARSYTQTLEVQSALTRARRGTLTVAERHRGVSTLADVRRLDLSYTRLAPQILAYELTLVADDPLRYGAATMPLENGTIQVPNLGDADAWPLIRMPSPHGEVTIEHDDGVLTLTAFSLGERLVDCRNGDVWNQGQRQLTAASGPWPRIRPGGTSWTVSGLGAGGARLERYGAWT